MSDIKTATVEALTAEVRVLMVGSRQVTLSVYSQLDVVDFDLIEPFGRVRPKDALEHEIWVVGRATDDGGLVRSWLPYLGDCAYSDLDIDPIYTLIKGQAHMQLRRHSDYYRVPVAYRGREVEAHDLTHFWAELPLIVLAGLR